MQKDYISSELKKCKDSGISQAQTIEALGKKYNDAMNLLYYFLENSIGSVMVSDVSKEQSADIKIAESLELITDLTFEELVFAATGKKFGDYGFIAGLAHPFSGTSTPNMLSASRVDGFTIWKRIANGDSKQKELKTSTIQETFRETVKFLLEP